MNPPNVPQPYAAYFSIYTDLRGRQQFRKLYWDRLKDLIGRPAKLVGIEREELWPSGLPSHELRCHVWRYFRAADDASAIIETLRSTMRLAPEWRLLGLWQPTGQHEDVCELIWDRRDDDPHGIARLPLAKLTSIMVSLRRDTGFRVSPGVTVSHGGSTARPSSVEVIAPSSRLRSYTVDWRVQVQTSNQRKLMDTHWPLLQVRFGDTAQMVDLEMRSGDQGPFRFTVRQLRAAISGKDLVSEVLPKCVGMSMEIEADSEGGWVRFRGRRENYPDAHQVLGVEGRET